LSGEEDQTWCSEHGGKRLATELSPVLW
jgi:hypothetical protein